MEKLQLYEKTMQGGRVRYIPWQERYRATLHLEDAELCTILSGMVTGFLLAAEDHYPPHARVRREIKKVEDALVSLAQAVGTVTEPSEKMMTLAVMGWNAAIKAMEEGLTVVGEA